MALEGKNIIILESSDQGGKSSLSQYLHNYVNGKCHVLHSNFMPDLPKENHRRQHFLMSRFASKQFDNKHYTGNRLVILDRNYISDIIYGKIKYGSRGSFKQKISTLNKLFKILTKNKDVRVSIIYCRPEKESFFEKDKKEELLSLKQNQFIQKFYDDFFESSEFFEVLIMNNIYFYRYDYISDPNYEQLIKEIEFNEN